MTDTVLFPQMPPKKKPRGSLDFEPQVDHMPDFLKALDELVTLYEKQDDFRAESFKKARKALKGQIITSVDDIKLFKLSELDGVGKATLECLQELIETNKIERLEKLYEEVSESDYVEFWKVAEKDLRQAIALLPEEAKLTVGTNGLLMLNGQDKDRYVTRGCPLTFTYGVLSFTVDGSTEIQEYSGIPCGLLVKGTITRNGKKAVDLYIDMQSGNDDFEELSFDTEKLGIPASEEDDFVEDFKEAFRENVFDEYDGRLVGNNNKVGVVFTEHIGWLSFLCKSINIETCTGVLFIVKIEDIAHVGRLKLLENVQAYHLVSCLFEHFADAARPLEQNCNIWGWPRATRGRHLN